MPIHVKFAREGSKVASISAGAKHACIVDNHGFVYSWGSGGDWFKGNFR